ncbi:hypothetical protein QR680_009082 [Steinernema hermaphroditum]|uniref:OCIA domain-containing protein n=1 Tax=Steinernema hermaphroditum TaxID=289476 RepID=A0AA39ILC7_9BILA|nr:hypothetical protein QR680_009082 [Steinernema hermaphroditum]
MESSPPGPLGDDMMSSSSEGDGKGLMINSEQMQWLLKRISSEDQEKLTTTLKSCTSEMTLGRGLPFALGVMGAMYYARQKLPQKLHFGPKGPWFYALIGFTSLTAANFLSMSTCSERIRPMLNDLWLKYSNETKSTGTTYEMLRQRNRANIGVHMPADSKSAAVQESFTMSGLSNYPSALRGNSGAASSSAGFLYDRDQGYMSGTPISTPSQSGDTANQYGDVGFN